MVKFRHQRNKGNCMTAACCRPPYQEEEVEEEFFLQLQEESYLQALILIGAFSHPGISWKSGTANCKQPRKLLECDEDNFLVEVTESLSRGEALLDLLLTNEEELIKKVKTGCNPGCSNHALVQFSILRRTGQRKSGASTLNLRKANFSLVRALVSGILWESAHRDKGAKKSWEVRKDII